MPNLDPYEIADRGLTNLKKDLSEKYRKLNLAKLPVEEHDRYIVQWNKQYETAKAENTAVRAQLDDLKTAMESGQISQRDGQIAQWSLIAPPATVRAMFPPTTQQPRGRFTPGEAETYEAAFAEHAEELVQKTHWGLPGLSESSVDPKALKVLYFYDRAQYGYDNMSAEEKTGYDLTWDRAMRADLAVQKVWATVKDDPQVLSSRTRNQRLLEIMGKKISPLGQALMPKPRREIYGPMTGSMPFSGQPQTQVAPAKKSRKLTDQEARIILKQAGGDVNKAAQIATKLGYDINE